MKLKIEVYKFKWMGKIKRKSWNVRTKVQEYITKSAKKLKIRFLRKLQIEIEESTTKIFDNLKWYFI